MMELVRLDVGDYGVATITLARPERLNAINMQMRDLLWSYLEVCRDVPDVEVIVFEGEGRAFSAGADISEFGTAPSIMESRRARHDRDVWGAMLSHRCLTVAVMHGYCYGAGLELPLCCDVRIADRDTTFALPEVSLGYIPSAGATQTLPRRIPAGVAAQMILSGEPVGTDEALRWGLVDEVFEREAREKAITHAVATARHEARALREKRVTLARPRGTAH